MKRVITTPEIQQIHYVICKSNKKARYEFARLLHTYMKLEYRTMPYNNVQ